VTNTALAIGLLLGVFVHISGAYGATGARLAGRFAMTGKITYARNVFGEHAGQGVRRNWTFYPQCPGSDCARVILWRQRSGPRTLDRVVLDRVAPGLYRGRGRFWVRLRCSGRIDEHGGAALEAITVTVTRARTVGITPFATAVKATYDNPARFNYTRCPGGIGRDAARYSGPLASALPQPPVTAFTQAISALPTTVSFTDESRPQQGGAPLVSWRWDFGDPGSGAANDSSSARDPVHAFSAHGTYTVTLTAKDAFGLETTVAHAITV